MNLFGTKPTAGLADGARHDIGGVTVRLSVSRRARRISLRIDPARREVIAIAPSARRLVEALAFARERRPWAAERLAALPPPASLAMKEHLSLFGEACRLVPDGRRPRMVAATEGACARLTGCGEGSVDRALVARAIKREALAVFTTRARAHCAALGVPVPRIAMADARTRWGSCSPARAGRPAAIRLSWRLALAPFGVADYVVAHECAHLVEANHGSGFWALVEGLIGDPAPFRAWLRSNGATLQAFGE
jgi:predicted metal-dependent hydrolase